MVTPGTVVPIGKLTSGETSSDPEMSASAASDSAILSSPMQKNEVSVRNAVAPGQCLRVVVGDSEAQRLIGKPGDLAGVFTVRPVKNRTPLQQIAGGIPLDESARADSVDIAVWDPDAVLPGDLRVELNGQPVSASRLRLLRNPCLLKNWKMEGPALVPSEKGLCLSMTPRFDVHYHTEGYSGQLAELRMVESQRFVELESGRIHWLQDTREAELPVLISARSDAPLELPKATGEASAFVQCTAAQPAGTTEDYEFCTPVSQRIPDELSGEKVKTVTVLEQYTSFILQRSCEPGSGQSASRENLWVPALAPLSWGWSIRVGKVGFDEWSIVRRKVFLPTPGNDGLQLPRWCGHITDFQTGRE